MRRVLSPLALILSVALCTLGLITSAMAGAPLHPVHPLHPAAPAVSSRITEPVDETHVVRMARNTRPEANPANDRGAVPDAFDIDHILLVMQRSAEQQQDLDKFVVELNDRGSANFHKWLTPEEFGERFGVSQEDYDTVTSWLESHGFRINQVYPSRMMIDFSGNAGQIRSAFHTEMHNLEVNGQTHLSNMSDPLIPAALAQVVVGIASLNDFKPHATHKIKPDYTFAGCASSAAVPTEPGTCYAVTPADTQTIYNLNPAYSAGYSGQGQTVAMIEDTDTYGGTSPTGDVATYRNTFGLSTAFPLGTYTVAHPGGCTDPGTNADDSEANLDVEVAFSVAPSANIELISCPSGTVTFGGLIALTNLVNAAGPYPGVASVSYGVCEALNGNGGNAAFANTYALAATEGISVFVSTGDDGPSSCTNEFGQNYDVSGPAVTGWGESVYNVAVGGTDFEDVYNFKTGQNGGAPLSTYWGSTNSSNYGSALSYIPEMPWDDACANTMISEVATGSFAPYGASPATCNNSTFDVSTSYLSIGAASGGASNCATGEEGTNASSSAIVSPQCQGYSKPSWQTGASLKGGLPVYGSSNDGVRDIPDVVMFAANGDWGHFETVCWSDPAYTADGSASCAGAPSSWSGFGGTSVATPTMAAIQALVNQKTGEMWGNPNPIYYQIGQNQYGTAGGSFLGTGCNSSTGNASGCAFNDVTQGDIDLECEYDGTVQEAHCYKPAGTYGVTSTNNITAAAVLVGGSGYTSAPTCTIAGPSNNNPYKSPTGTTLWAGGTQATCTATVNSGTNTAKWTVVITSATYAPGQTILVTAGSTTCGPYTLTGTTTRTIASNLGAAIGTACSLASESVSNATVTLTAKTAGAAGNFSVSFGTAEEFNNFGVAITNTTLGEGPNYVSGISITAAGSGYQPETPITLGAPTAGGVQAVAVANTSFTTGAQSYQPAYGAAPGWDMASGLGSINGYNLMNNCVWTSSCVTIQSQTITVTAAPPASSAYNSTFNVAATASSGLAVAITSSGSCSGSGSGSATITITSGTGTCSTIFNQAGNSSYSAAPTITDTTSATPAAQTITLTNVPASAAYGQSFTVSATGGASGNAVVLTSDGVVCSNSGATYTIIASSGNCSVIANQAGNSNYSAAPQVTDLVEATTATSSTSVSSSPNPSTYGQSVTFTATISGEYGLVKKNLKSRVKAQGVKSQETTGSVTWNDSNGPLTCTESGSSTTTVSNGAATCTLSNLPVSTDTVTGTYSGDSNHTGSSGSTIQTINAAGAGVSVVGTPDPSTYGQTVVFTATISGQYGLIKGRKQQIATGSVSWTDVNGSMSCAEGNPSTVTSGAATCTVSNLAVNSSDTITAAYSGDSNHNPGTGTTSQEIDLATTTTGVTSSPNPSTYAQQVVFTATITAENGLVKGRTTKNGVKRQVAGGSVTWSTNTGCGTTTVTNGVATCTTSAATSLPVGSDTVTATYSGDSNHSGSTGSVIQVVQGGIATTINVTGVSPSSEDYGADSPVTITAVLSWTGYGVAPTASDVTISGNGNGAYSATTCNPRVHETITCTATYTPSNGDGAGSYTETAAFSGDTNYSPSSSPQTNNFTINQASSSTAVTTSGSPSAVGQSVTFTATISGENNFVKGRVKRNGVKSNDITGTVTWSSNTGCAASTVSGYPGVATCITSSLPLGTDNVTATYSGDSNHGESVGSFSQVVNAAASSIGVTSVSPASEAYGQDAPTTITAVLSWTGSGPAPTASNVTIGGTGATGGYSGTTCGAPNNNTITCTATYTPGTDAPGTYTETAAFSGDSNYSASSSAQTNNFTITQANSSVSVGSNNNPSTYGQTVVFTATVSGQYGQVKRRNLKVKSQDVSGTVAWSDANGSLACAEGNPTAITSGTTTCTVSNLAGNPSDTITAAYSGDSNHSASSGTLSQVINPAAQTVTFTTNAPASAVYGSTFAVAATGGASGNPVTFASAGGCSNVGATYTMTSGTTACSVTANQAGNNNYAAGSKTETTTAKLATQTITFTTKAPASAVYGTNFTVAATATSGLAVVYSASGGCSNVGATYTMTSGSGSCIVQANQPGNTNYSAATQVTETVAAAPASQTITVTTPAPATAVYGSSFTVAATASSGMAVAYSSSGGCTNVGATFTMESSGSTACTVKYNQGGNNNYKAATQITETTTPVTGTPPTVSFTGAPATAPYLGTFPVTASTNAGVNAAITTKGSCTVSGTSGSSTNETATVTITSDTGTCTITASWPATSVYAAITMTQSTIEEKATPTVSWANPAPIIYGTPLSATQLDATASVAGTFKYTPAAGKVLAAGTQTLSVTFTPTSKDYSSVTQKATLVVNQASTTTTITSISPSNPTAGTKVTVDFTVSNGTTSYPTGKVTVSDNAGDTACSATVSKGVASCKITLKTAGAVTLTATYPGDANDTGSSGTYALTVQE